MSVKTQNTRILFLNLALTLLVAAAVLLPRALELGRFVVVDEVDWLQASANFYNALQTGELHNTYQLEHPAVPTLWAGALGFMRTFAGDMEYKSGYVTSINQLHTDLLRAGTSPLAVLVQGRLFVVLAITACMALAFWQLSRLVGPFPALVAALLLALDPFFTGLSRLLHMDALLACFFLLFALALLLYLRQGKPIDLLIAGAAAGLAGLTKSPAVFLAPYALALLALSWWQPAEGTEKRSVNQSGKILLLLGAIALAVFVLCWPAMWVAPMATLRRIIEGALFYAKQGHFSQLFFNGRVSNGADFPLSFYPLTFLWRTTPATVAGLLAAVIAYWRRWGVFQRQSARQLALALLLLALGFMAFMHLGAKKFDRYILPSHLALVTLAGFGWVSLASLTAKFSAWQPYLYAGLVVLSQYANLSSVFPYALSYYNPVMGGPQQAPEVMMIGWGEGLDQAAAYLNSTPQSGKLQVAAGYGIGPLSFYFNREFIHQPNVVNMENEWGPQNADKLRHADYLVLYVNQWQRGYVQPLLQLLAQVEPEHTVEINHIEYARIYRLDNLPQAAYQELLENE